jgi:hypothetical protein
VRFISLHAFTTRAYSLIRTASSRASRIARERSPLHWTCPRHQALITALSCSAAAAANYERLLHDVVFKLLREAALDITSVAVAGDYSACHRAMQPHASLRSEPPRASRTTLTFKQRDWLRSEFCHSPLELAQSCASAGEFSAWNARPCAGPSQRPASSLQRMCYEA